MPNVDITGRVYVADGTIEMPSATVRLYNASTGALVEETTSDSGGVFTFSGYDDTSYTRYFCVALTDTVHAGVCYVKFVHTIIEEHIPRAIVEVDTDLRIVEFPTENTALLTKVEIAQSIDTTGSGTLQVFTQADGNGESFDVTITAGTNYWSDTGKLFSPTGFYYIRFSTVPTDMVDVSITLWFLNPTLRYPGELVES